jgi:hypothetical protein
MIFQEKKNKNGYTYKVEDVFGTIMIDSSVKLEPGILDDLVVLLLKTNMSAKIITGEVKHKTGVVQYRFERAPLWDNNDEPCENTPISTPEPASAFTPTHRLRLPILSWCRRFAEAFREAWRKGKHYQDTSGKSTASEIKK